MPLGWFRHSYLAFSVVRSIVFDTLKDNRGEGRLPECLHYLK